MKPVNDSSINSDWVSQTLYILKKKKNQSVNEILMQRFLMIIMMMMMMTMMFSLCEAEMGQET